MKKGLIALCMLLTAALAAPGGAVAETVCISVKIEILQELTLGRIAYCFLSIPRYQYEESKQ